MLAAKKELVSAVKEAVKKLVNKIKKTTSKLMVDFYHGYMLMTPEEFKWKYKFDRCGELEEFKLLDDEHICLASFNTLTSLLCVTGDDASATYVAKEGVSMWTIQRKIMRFLLHDTGKKVFRGKDFELISYQRIFDRIENTEILGSEYKWIVNLFHLYLKKGNKVICEINRENGKYRFRNENWEYIPSADEQAFRKYIEDRERRAL